MAHKTGSCYNPSQTTPASPVNTRQYQWTEKIKSTDPISYESVSSKKVVKSNG
jgi:hypothetical protein